MIESSRTAKGGPCGDTVLTTRQSCTLMRVRQNSRSHGRNTKTKSCVRRDYLPYSPALLQQTSFVCHFKLVQRQTVGHRLTRYEETGEITWFSHS